jgi:hypothetical protein
MLTRNSPQAGAIPKTALVLKGHQSAMVKRCLETEKNIDDYPYGVINTPVGSGKTFVCLSLPLLDKHKPAAGNSLWANIFGSSSDPDSGVTTGATMIVVPSHLFSQWQDAIKKFLEGGNGGLKIKVFNKYTDVTNIYHNENALKEADVFLISSLYFNVVSTTIKTMKINIRRIIFDELDNMAEMVKELPAAAMYWFVSATIGAMLKADASGNVDIGDKKVPLSEIVKRQIRVDEAFIREGFALPAVQYEEVLVPNVSVKQFSAIASANHMYRMAKEGASAQKDDGIVKALNACDGKTALLRAKYADITPTPTKNDSQVYEQVKKSWKAYAEKTEETIKSMKESLDEEGIEREKDSIRVLERQVEDCRQLLSSAGWDPSAADLAVEDRPKMKRLYVLLEELNRQKRKVILFSEFPRVYNEVTDFLKSKSIVYTDLDAGNEKAMGAAITKYKSGEANILLLYSAMFSCGTNLENTTDIILLHKVDKHVEDQIVGRGQRPGRTGALRVFRLLHENEKI